MKTAKNIVQKKSKKDVSDDDSSDVSDDYETLSEMDTSDDDDSDDDSLSDDDDSDDASDDDSDDDDASLSDPLAENNLKELVRAIFQTEKNRNLETTPLKKKDKAPETPQKKTKSKSEEKYKGKYKLRNMKEKDEEDEDEEEKEEKKSKKSAKKDKKQSKKKLPLDSASLNDDDDDDDESIPVKNSKKEKQTCKIYVIGESTSGGIDDYDDDDYDEDDDDDYMEDLMEEHDEEEYKKEEEAVFMKEKYEKLEDPPAEASTSKKNKKRKNKDEKKDTDKDTDKDKDAEKKPTIEEEYMQLLQTKKMLLQEMKKRPNKIYKNALEECNKDIKELVRRGKKENLKRYHQLIKQERKKQNEYDYFRKELSNQEQNRIIDDLDKITKNSSHKKPYRFTILESSISPNLKSIALQKVNQLSSMCSSDSEYHKIKNWIDTFMKIPFGIHKNIEVNMERDGIEACNQFMMRAQNILDECTYGLKEAKLQIMQMLGNWMTNPSAVGTAIAIKGPPGTGKTSLVKDGISKIMGREFVFIPLGGAGDGSYLEGHSYTYEGSCWGKIVQSLMDCKSMNPVFYFDELDKISDSPRGQEIMGILTHLTDTTQNSQFTDKYFAEINEFDLSKCLFIFSYNDESKISPILLNRMHIIATKGYSVEDKLVIGRKYLLPKIIQQVNMTETDVVLTDDILRTILTNEQYIQKEDGVRNFKRCLEIIHSKINLFRVMKPDNDFFQFYKDIPINVSFPYTLVKKDLDLLVKNEGGFNPALSSMYI